MTTPQYPPNGTWRECVLAAAFLPACHPMTCHMIFIVPARGTPGRLHPDAVRKRPRPVPPRQRMVTPSCLDGTLSAPHTPGGTTGEESPMRTRRRRTTIPAPADGSAPER
ncbi:hypothetical protein Cs7R123_46430 [Catellatospora sp. TT07R-123]|nr:hypothetical protein Cs7R123_46430 [Catellatospora sp. TT07R-123]